MNAGNYNERDQASEQRFIRKPEGIRLGRFRVADMRTGMNAQKRR